MRKSMTSFSSELAKAKLTRLKRNHMITPAQFLQCSGVCVSRDEMLFLIMSFLSVLPQHDDLKKEIHQIQNHIVNLNYDKACDVIKNILDKKDAYIEARAQEKWSACIQDMQAFLGDKKELKSKINKTQAEGLIGRFNSIFQKMQHYFTKSPQQQKVKLNTKERKDTRRFFETIFAARYLENLDVISSMQQLWPNQKINDAESIIEFIATLNKNNTLFTDDTWKSSGIGV